MDRDVGPPAGEPDTGEPTFTDNLTSFYDSPAKILLIFSMSILVSEVVVLLMLHNFPIPPHIEAVFHAAFLLLVLLPVFYFCLFMPMAHHIGEFRRVNAELKQLNEELDQRVQQRTAQLADVNAELKEEINERKKIEEQLRQQTITDRLTGIFNRRHFDASLAQELERARRYRNQFSLIMFDVDYFKRVNDQFGHLAGDAVLIELAKLVACEIRKNDIFARWGGEEFVLLIHGSNVTAAQRLAEKLRAKIEQHQFQHVGRITCSFGVAEYVAGDTSTDIIKKSDKVLYLAKEKGRNRLEVA